MPTMIYADDDPEFMQKVNKYEYPLRVAFQFKKQGFKVFLPDALGTPEGNNSVNKPDVVVKADNGREINIKVIPIDESFVQKERFPDAVVSLVSKDCWDSYSSKPNIIILVSKHTKAILIVPFLTTFDKWTVEERIDTKLMPQQTYGILADETMNFTDCIRRLRRNVRF